MAQADLKTAVGAAVVAYLGPILGPYSMILLGGVVGGVIAIELDDRGGSVWRAIGVMLTGVSVALTFGAAVAQVAPSVAPDSWGLSPDLLWVPVAATLAALWRHIAKAGVAMLKRLGGKP